LGEGGTLPREKVYILLLNWNGWPDTIECLESVFRSDYPNYQVVVCDNDSQDGSLEYVKAWADGRLNVAVPLTNPLRHTSFPPLPKPIEYLEFNRQQAEGGCTGPGVGEARLVLIRTGANLGFAGGNNVGLRYALSNADFGYVWLLNNDTVADRSALTGLVSHADSHQRIGMCGSSLVRYDAPDRYQALGGASYNKWLGIARHIGEGALVGGKINHGQVEMAMSYVVGASMLVSSRFLRSVGLMEEGYFLYSEELDWATRGRGNFSLAYAINSIVYHKVGASIGSKHSAEAEKRLRSEYYSVKNRLAFTRRHYPYALPTVCLGILITLVIRALRGQWSRVTLLFKVLLKVAVRDSG
jgi:GT2 family glycosyltransferase